MFLIALVLVRRRTDTPREKIRSYIFFVFVIGLTAMIPLFWLVGNYVVGHQFKSLERERTETAADRLQELSSSEVQVLTELSLQYSVWDDSYNYVMKQIRNYEAANYQQDVIFDGRLSGAYIFNKNRQFLFCQKYLYAEKQYIPCAEKGKDAQKIQQILETHFQKINN